MTARIYSYDFRYQTHPSEELAKSTNGLVEELAWVCPISIKRNLMAVWRIVPCDPLPVYTTLNVNLVCADAREGRN